jgi:hypothetical protein
VFRSRKACPAQRGIKRRYIQSSGILRSEPIRTSPRFNRPQQFRRSGDLSLRIRWSCPFSAFEFQFSAPSAGPLIITSSLAWLSAPNILQFWSGLMADHWYYQDISTDFFTSVFFVTFIQFIDFTRIAGVKPTCWA